MYVYCNTVQCTRKLQFYVLCVMCHVTYVMWYASLSIKDNRYFEQEQGYTSSTNRKWRFGLIGKKTFFGKNFEMMPDPAKKIL